jgi:hypothetical protein
MGLMKRLWIALLVMLFAPAILCLAQEPKEPSEKQDPARRVEVTIPPGLPPEFAGAGAIELGPEANAWVVQILSRGGLDGRGRGDLMVRSDGLMTWRAAGRVCESKLSAEAMESLTQVVRTVSGAGWVNYMRGHCYDCYITAVIVQRREPDESTRLYMAGWDLGEIPDEVKKVYESFIRYKGCNR